MHLPLSVPRALRFLLGVAVSAVVVTSARSDTPGAPADSTRPAYMGESGGTFYERGDFLPDTFVLGRVDDRLIRVIDYRERYFSSDIQFRPTPDSTGRVSFLNSMIHKDVMGLTALAVGHDLDFEDRMTMRNYTSTVLTNVLYQRMVYDSLQFSREELESYLPQFDKQVKLQQIRFLDPARAERARRDLVTGRITWSDAARQYGQEKETGDVGWVSRPSLQGALALAAFALPPDSISAVVPDAGSYYVVRALETRPDESIPRHVALRLIARDLRAARSQAISNRIFAAMRVRAGVNYDSTNIRWAAQRFAEISPPPSARGQDAPTIDMRDRTPDLSAADGARVLARSSDRTYTLADFLTSYKTILPMYRPYLGTVELFVPVLDRFFFQPMLVDEARKRGLDHDSLAVAEIGKKREELLVDHLYQDSVLAHVSVSKEEMKRYYDEHSYEFVTKVRVRYAYIGRYTEAGADSVAAALRAGADPELLVRNEVAAGSRVASIRDQYDHESVEFRKLLFEDMRPGETAKLGPDKNGAFVVLHVIEHQDPKPMSFEDSEEIVRESITNTRAEQLLDAFLARQSRLHHIEAHPELVMRIKLSDPVMDSI